MNRGWENQVEIGIILPKLFQGIAEDEKKYKEALETILKDPFFTVVEVSYTENQRSVELVRKYAQIAGVEVVFNGGDAFRRLQIDLSSLDQEIRKESVEKAKILIDQCYAQKAKIFHVVTGKYQSEEKTAPMLEAFEQSLEELCAYAKEKQTDYLLMISVETGDRYYDRHYLLGPTNEAVGVLRKVKEKYENIGLLLDQSHFPVMHEDPIKALWEGKDYLTHIHVGNSYIEDQTKPYFGDKHLPFGVPGSEVGVRELTEFLKGLEDIGFYKKPKATRKPLISFEVGPFDDESPQIVIANIKRVFFEAWQNFKQQGETR